MGDGNKERTLETLKALCADPTFVRDIDAMSCEVIQLCEDFVIQHRRNLFSALGPEAHVETVVQFLVGWIAGFQSSDPAHPAADQNEMLERMIVIAFAAGRSAGNCDRIRRQQLQ